MCKRGFILGLFSPTYKVMSTEYVTVDFSLTSVEVLSNKQPDWLEIHWKLVQHCLVLTYQKDISSAWHDHLRYRTQILSLTFSWVSIQDKHNYYKHNYSVTLLFVMSLVFTFVLFIFVCFIASTIVCIYYYMFLSFLFKFLTNLCSQFVYMQNQFRVSFHLDLGFWCHISI